MWLPLAASGVHMHLARLRTTLDGFRTADFMCWIRIITIVGLHSLTHPVSASTLRELGRSRNPNTKGKQFIVVPWLDGRHNNMVTWCINGHPKRKIMIRYGPIT
jgi:hypothetical protein